MIASNIQNSAAAEFWISSLGSEEILLASKIQNAAAAAAELRTSQAGH